MRHRLAVLAILAILFSACEKDEDENLCPNENPPGDGGLTEFSVPSTEGSYWVYQWYEVDYSTGLAEELSRVDSVYISGDSLINGHEYAVYKGTWWPLSGMFERFERDSSGFIVNNFGSIVYSYTNFTDTLNSGNFDFLWNWYVQMFDGQNVAVPAGNFPAIERRVHFYYPSNEPANQCGDQVITQGIMYVSGIGKVLEQTGYSAPLIACSHYTEARLIRYYIAP